MMGKEEITSSGAVERSQKRKKKNKTQIRRNEGEKNFTRFITSLQESDDDESSDESRINRRKVKGRGR
jgi:hypothetical protein